VFAVRYGPTAFDPLLFCLFWKSFFAVDLGELGATQYSAWALGGVGVKSVTLLRFKVGGVPMVQCGWYP
jgi:hypothetical protein